MDTQSQPRPSRIRKIKIRYAGADFTEDQNCHQFLVDFLVSESSVPLIKN